MGSKKPYMGAILTQVFLAGMSLLSKAAFASGMNSYVFIFYRQAVGTVFFIPAMIILKRKESRPQLSLMDFFKIFMISMIGITIGTNAYAVAVNYTTANFGAAAFNCLPVTTFLFALILRMEKLNIKRFPGIAKTIGLLVCLAGVGVLAFYKGSYLKPFINHQIIEFDKSHSQPHQTQKRWIIGCFCLFISTISWGMWLVFQEGGVGFWPRITFSLEEAQFLKTYPSTLVFTGHLTTLSIIPTFVLAIVMERNPCEWKLGWNIRLFAVLYCGSFAGVITNALQCWVIKEKGPLFQAMTTPFNLLLTIIGSELLLAEGIHFGSLIGAVLLVMSLYIVLWAKSKELSMVNKDIDKSAAVSEA